MSDFDYGETKSDGQHSTHPTLHDGAPTQPIRLIYLHKTCGDKTQMPETVAKTFAIDQKFYQRTFCCKCKAYLPCGQFVWPEDNIPINEPIPKK